MPFQYKRQEQFLKTLSMYFPGTKTLQLKGCSLLPLLHREVNEIEGDKQRKSNGSITVEAAVVMPLFIYGIIAFMYFFQIIYIQECVQSGMTQVAREASRYGYIYEDISEVQPEEQSTATSIFNGTFYKMRLNQYLMASNMSDSCIMGGRNGIIMQLSSFMEDGETIEIIAAYRIKIPVALISVKGFQMVQRVKTRAFIGMDYSEKGNGTWGEEKNDDNQIVYITENGTVYHYKKTCTHLKLSIKGVKPEQLPLLRNDNGGKYKPCERCVKEESSEGRDWVYITTEGNRFHTTLECSGLKRTIFSVFLSEVRARGACKRCR